MFHTPSSEWESHSLCEASIPDFDKKHSWKDLWAEEAQMQGTHCHSETFVFWDEQQKKKDSSSLAGVACMDTCTSLYLLPYLLPVLFLGCISLLAATGSDPFIRKQIRCRWPTSKCSHLYSAATTSQEEVLLIDLQWDLALDQILDLGCVLENRHIQLVPESIFLNRPRAKNYDSRTYKNYLEAAVWRAKIKQ